MDNYFKRKKSTSLVDDPITIDESVLLVKNSDKEFISSQPTSNDDDSLIIIEDSDSNGLKNKLPNEKLKADLKQLLSGRSNTENVSTQKSLITTEKTNKTILKRSKTSNSCVKKKDVEMFKKNENDIKHGNNSVKRILNGNNNDVSPSTTNFFSQHKLKRFHNWSSKKLIDNPIYPQKLYVNDNQQSPKNTNIDLQKYYSKRIVGHDFIDYNSSGFINEFLPNEKATSNASTMKTIDVPATKRLKNLLDSDNELWTESLKPLTYEELSLLIPSETLLTLKYQLEVSLNFLKSKPDHDRQLLAHNWKSIMNKRNILNDSDNLDDLDSYDNDFVVDDDLIDEDGNEIPLDHIPLFILYGTGIGKNTTLKLLLKEMEKSGYNVNNILEINASMNRGKRDIFNICYEACTSKFLSNEDSIKDDLNKKSHLSGGVILFDEVDILFRSDVLFYPMIIKLLQVTKKPIVFTCSSLETIPEQFVKITNYQKTNFMITVPDTIIPFLNLKLGLKLDTESNDKYININRDIRHSLLQLQLDRQIEIEPPSEVVDEYTLYDSLNTKCKILEELSTNVDLMSFADVLENGTRYKSNITKSLDYSVLDFIDNEIYNDTMSLSKNNTRLQDPNGVDDYEDLSKKEAKIRLNGTINLQNLNHVNKLLSNQRNYYDEMTWNTIEDYELNVGKELEEIALERDSNLRGILRIPPDSSSQNKPKLTRNLYLKLEYMQSNSLPLKTHLQPTRTTINEFLVNLETSKDNSLKNIKFADMIYKNYILNDNRLNYEFTTSNDLFCYHYPYFRSLFAVDIHNRELILSHLQEMENNDGIDRIQGLKHLIKEKRINQLLFDQDPRLYWEQ
ncbi:hypothetical protein ACO0R3_003130 [Hanseniaspora guilliermondii]